MVTTPIESCNPRNLNPEKAQGLSPELQAALEPLLSAIESLSERIHEYNQQIEKIARESYPQAARLEQVKGVGTLIALTYLLTLEDPHRFRKSRDVGCDVGLQPGRRNSGQSEPQLHISKVGDPYPCACDRALRLRRSPCIRPMTPSSGGRRRLRSRAPWPGFCG